MPTARAPGRVTIIGDHTDYNGGLSLPMAIDLATEVTFTSRPGSFLVGIDSDQFPDHPLEIALGSGAPVPPEALLAAALLRLAAPASGGTIGVTSTLPVGAGLASSAAFSVALLLALGHDPDPVSLARDARRPSAAPGPTWACSIRWPSPPPVPATGCSSTSARWRLVMSRFPTTLRS